MKIFLLVFSLFFSLASFSQKELPPAPKTFIYDETNLFNPQEKMELNAKLENFEKQTGGQMVVAVFQTLQNENFEDYVNRLFRHWGIGQKDKNNGVLVVVSLGDRSYRTEVGYGFEGVLTDALTANLQREILVPSFREGKFFNGFSILIDEYTQTILSKGEYVSEYQGKSYKGNILRLVLFFFIFALFLFPVFLDFQTLYTSNTRRRNRWWHSGGDWGSSGWGGGGSGGGFSGGGGWSGGGGSSGKW